MVRGSFPGKSALNPSLIRPALGVGGLLICSDRISPKKRNISTPNLPLIVSLSLLQTILSILRQKNYDYSNFLAYQACTTLKILQ